MPNVASVVAALEAGGVMIYPLLALTIAAFVIILCRRGTPPHSKPRSQ
jgi:hypothetical protein